MPAARISSRRFEAAAAGTSGNTAFFPGRSLRNTGIVAAADSHQLPSAAARLSVWVSASKELEMKRIKPRNALKI
jgi:hypothetical protein